MTEKQLPQWVRYLKAGLSAGRNKDVDMRALVLVDQMAEWGSEGELREIARAYVCNHTFFPTAAEFREFCEQSRYADVKTEEGNGRGYWAGLVEEMGAEKARAFHAQRRKHRAEVRSELYEKCGGCGERSQWANLDRCPFCLDLAASAVDENQEETV